MKLKLFVKSHKILTVSLSILILVICSVGCMAGMMLYSLSRINFVPKPYTPAVTPTAAAVTTTRPPVTTEPSTEPEPESETEPDTEPVSEELEEDVSRQLESADDEIVRNLSDTNIWHSDDVINILFAGIDRGSKNYPYGRSDSMLLFSVNKASHEMNIVSLSRAAYVAINGYNNTRLSHAHGYGSYPLMLQTIEQNYKIDIDNFISVGFSDFINIINLIGGCKIQLNEKEAKALKKAFERNHMPYVGAGIYQLNGDLALEYVRLRKIDTDRERTGRQRKIILSLIETAKSTRPMTLYNLMNKVLPYVTTDMTKSQLITLGYTALTDYKDWPIKQTVIPNSPTPLTLVGSFEVLKLNWQEELKYLHEVLYKDVPDERISYVA